MPRLFLSHLPVDDIAAPAPDSDNLFFFYRPLPASAPLGTKSRPATLLHRKFQRPARFTFLSSPPPSKLLHRILLSAATGVVRRVRLLVYLWQSTVLQIVLSQTGIAESCELEPETLI